MPYTADISRTSPACFLFLIDQSGSMDMALAGQPGQRKKDQAAQAINRHPQCGVLALLSGYGDSGLFPHRGSQL